jgi:hypothetical protein
MSRMSAIATSFLLAVTLSGLASVPALGGEKDRASAPAAPRTELFADGGRQLRLIEIPDYDGKGVAMTLVFDNGEAVHSVTIDPANAAGRDAAALQKFLDNVDEDFLSFVRASLADRILHLTEAASSFDRAQVAIFFRGKQPRLTLASVSERSPASAE